MTAPMMVLALTAMTTVMTASLRDHAALTAAADSAELRAQNAAAVLIEGCLSDQGCAAFGYDGVTACAGDAGVSVTAEVRWSPTLWKSLSAASATRIVAYRDGVAATVLQERIRATFDPC